MKSTTIFAASMVAAAVGLASPAQAIDCNRASNNVEHLICDDNHLVRADAAMGKAYAAILGATNDAAIRAMLVESQKQWIRKRDLRLGDVFNPDGSDEKPDRAVLRRNLLAAITDRTKALAARSRTAPKRPRMIEIALEQRAAAAQYTGGPFAGYEPDCDFYPSDRADQGPYGYSCFARHSYQNKNRVCTLNTDWATYRQYETHEVADVVDGKLKTVATCSMNDGTCPDPDAAPGEKPGWTRGPDPSSDAESASGHAAATFKPLPKIDADVGLEDAQPWLHACLTDSSYPHLDAAKPATSPLPGTGSRAEPHH